MPRLEPSEYLRHLTTDARRFREVVAQCDPAAPVPSCPDWRADDLLWHLADVQRWWGDVVIGRPKEPDSQEPERPGDRAGMLAAYDEWSDRLVTALEQAAPEEKAWTWHFDEATHTIGWILRRQAHEALIHRVDAELTAGMPSEVDARLAADGADEVLDVMYGGQPPWAQWEPRPHYVRIDLRDADVSVWCQLGHLTGRDSRGVDRDEDDFHVVPDPGVEPDTIIEGPAAAVDLNLWHRGPDEQLHLAGDQTLADQFRRVLQQPVN